MHHSRAIAALSLVASAAVPAQQPLPDWRLDAAPTLTIGGEGAPGTEFYRIRRAWRLPSGAVAVANGDSIEIRIFDARGALTQTFGRTGAGPGEFQSIDWVGAWGDTAVVYDRRSRRLTRILLSGRPRVIATIAMTATGGRQSFAVNGRLPDGRWTVLTSVSPTFDGPKGVYRVNGSVGTIAPAGGGTVNWVAEMPGMAIFAYSPTGDIKQAAVGPIAFTPLVASAASGSAIWFGESGSDSIVRLSANGARRRVVLPFPATAPTPEMVAAARESETRGAAVDPRSFTAVKFSAEYLPKRLPYFGALVAGADGELWVQQSAPVRSAAARYLVISAEARPVAWVTVPAGVRLTDIGRDHVVAVHQDADGIESVRVYRLGRR